MKVAVEEKYCFSFYENQNSEPNVWEDSNYKSSDRYRTLINETRDLLFIKNDGKDISVTGHTDNTYLVESNENIYIVEANTVVLINKLNLFSQVVEEKLYDVFERNAMMNGYLQATDNKKKLILYVAGLTLSQVRNEYQLKACRIPYLMGEDNSRYMDDYSYTSIPKTYSITNEDLERIKEGVLSKIANPDRKVNCFYCYSYFFRSAKF